MHQQILLVDDSKPIHVLVASLFENEPVTIHSAFDAHSGLSQAAALLPDLIVLDVEMPGLDGYEACRRLKADPTTAGLQIIFLTARATTGEMARGLDLGANDFVIKRFELSELPSRVRAALRISRLVRSLEEKALIDPLTGLGNGAMLRGRFAEEVARRIRSGSPFSCILLELDHFEVINDRYGRSFGDYLLQEIGKVLRDICRVEDVACRQDGNEFVVLAPRTSSDQAALLAERIRLAISNTLFSDQGETITVTCSIGVAEALGTFDRLMLDRADQALCTSRKEGRNRVSIASAHPNSKMVAA